VISITEQRSSRPNYPGCMGNWRKTVLYYFTNCSVRKGKDVYKDFSLCGPPCLCLQWWGWDVWLLLHVLHKGVIEWELYVNLGKEIQKAFSS